MAIAECGHAYKAFKHLAVEYIEEGRLQIKRSVVKGPITYHDPCQLVRNGVLSKSTANC